MEKLQPPMEHLNGLLMKHPRADVQVLRRQADAILVGTNTVIADNPHLVPRGDFEGFTNNPIRVICGEQELPKDAQVFDDAAQTVVVKSKDLEVTG
jgi:diaminohydroxyphosphoribosylaminopyrimidine deaminase / 5-amino-6-(5-phosphoribosylamino)uracil reductase